MQQRSTMRSIERLGPDPLPQPAYLRALARFFSYVFHPLFISVYVAAYLIYVHPYSFAVLGEKEKLLRMISVFVITVFFPAVTVLLLWRLQFADSIFLRTQKERIIPYVASIIYFFWAFFVTRNLPGTPQIMSFFFLGSFLSVSAALMANNYFKISMHSLAVGGATMYLLLLGLYSGEPMGVPIAVATLITGIVCTSRFVVSDHYPFEVYWGLALGAASQMVAYYIIM